MVGRDGDRLDVGRDELVEGRVFLEGCGCLARVSYEAEEIGEFFFCDEVCVFIVEDRDVLGGQKMLHVRDGNADGLDLGLGQIFYKGSWEVQMFKGVGHCDVGVARKIKRLAVALEESYGLGALRTVADI